MSDIHMSYSVKSNCWNLIDSYGEICVQCGCCQKDKKKRQEARIATIKEWIEDKQNFNMWSEDESLRRRQERNIKNDIKYFKRQLLYYEKAIEQEGKDAIKRT